MSPITEYVVAAQVDDRLRDAERYRRIRTARAGRKARARTGEPRR